MIDNHYDEALAISIQIQSTEMAHSLSVDLEVSVHIGATAEVIFDPIEELYDMTIYLQNQDDSWDEVINFVGYQEELIGELQLMLKLGYIYEMREWS